ncbi:CopG family transcriptional regulator [Candidatus Poriferisodalis sp.]|uniref:CopG family transcriptional regulator n=1 Tax=Candidatus Poriferisodalis sp. TaxID=3101277 RepID=UPI003AF7518D
MRTTVSLDDAIYDEARRIAFESRRTLGEVINELLAAGLKQAARPPARRQLGQLRGTITIADDFDDTPAEVLESLDDPL